jgi:NAD(P)-dependent dehydrogenase (short-subunit alcohol dehydrogenase family)
MRLKDRVAIVTGGGGGIGEGISLCLAREGAHVAVGDVKPEPAEHVAGKVRETGRMAVAVGIDVSQPDQVQTLIDTTLSQLGGLDILVCCAGIGGHVHRGIDSDEPLTLENVRVEDWDLTLDAIVRRTIPLKRYQTAEDIGHAVVFLASDEAKEITGQAINVCGGMAMN